MNRLAILTLSATLSACPHPPPAASATASRCALGAPPQWAQCVGAPVAFEGQLSRVVTNHPMLAPALDPATRQGQTYVDAADGTQLIIIADRAEPCRGTVWVTGTLERVDLGGAAGTPESYQGWAVRAATVTCD
jgi:hypothetical protein